ncbi:hypothetical protein BDF19DRAFT_421811 [Syncephalis fuscata]|nr:hypothetical protein BDF19DRAFT_421811 [Syncephalis fuscata]
MRVSLLGRVYALCLLVCCCLQLPGPALALYEDQAGLYDWHIPLIGVPKQSFFHRADTRSRQLLLLTDRGILASVQPRSGTLVWRHNLNHGTGTIVANHTCRALGEYIATVSSTDKISLLRVWDVKSSFLVWEYVYTRTVSTGHSSADIVFTPNGDVILLTECKHLTRFSAKDGKKLWQTELKISDTDCYQNVIITNNDQLHVTGQSSKSKPIVIDVDAVSGKANTANTSLKSTVDSTITWIQAMDSTLYYGMWIEKSSKPRGWTLYAQSITNNKSISLSLKFEKDVEINVQAFSENSQVISVTARTLTLDQYYTYLITLQDDKLVKTVEYNNPSVFGHVHTDNQKQLLVARLSATEDENNVDVNVYNLRQPEVSAFSSKVSFSLKSTGPLANAIFEAATNDQNEIMAIRTLTTTADGSIHLLRDTKHVWTREESLADIVSMEPIDLPENNLVSWEHDELEEPVELSEHISSIQRFTRRVTTHTDKLIRYLRNLINSSDTATTNSSNESLENSDNSTTRPLRKDTFGLRKLLVFVTRSGKLVALDTSHKGRVIWSRFQGSSGLDKIKIHGMYHVRSTIVKYPPLLALVVTKYHQKTPETTILCIDALTGQDYSAPSNIVTLSTFSFDPLKIYRLPQETSHPEHIQLLALLDDQYEIHLWPNMPEARQQLLGHANQLVFAHGLQLSSSRLSGHQLAANQDHLPSSLATKETWSLLLPDDLHIIATAQHSIYDPTASIGKTLGDRSVLFKYLNPNLIGIAAVKKDDATGDRLYVYLVDTVSGTILHQTFYNDVVVDALHPVHMVLSENWLVITYSGRGNGRTGVTKGYQAIVLELYESILEDVRVESEVFSSFNPHRPYVLSQMYTLPYGVDAIGATTTRRGITTKQVLVALPSGQLFGISRRFIDARRSTDPLSEADREEGLLPYEPAIPFNPSWVLSYNQTLWGIKEIVSTPSMMESTALVVAYGLDIYFTRDTPSGTFDMLNEDFSKSALLLTIVGLTLGIMVANPMVRRKKLNARWK